MALVDCSLNISIDFFFGSKKVGLTGFAGVIGLATDTLTAHLSGHSGDAESISSDAIGIYVLIDHLPQVLCVVRS